MKKKILMWLALLLVALPSLSRDFEYTYEGQTLTYTVIDEDAKTCSTRSSENCSANYVSGNLIIPSIAKDGNSEYTVIALGTFAFYGNGGLESIEIPSSVTTIGNSALRECYGLTSIEIPNSVKTIGNRAFSGCTGLTSIEIPNSVVSIGDYVFDHCTRLTSIKIPNSVTTIGDYAFWYCELLTSIEIPNSVTSIGERTFDGCTGLKSIEMPNTVTTIGDYAFYRCYSLTSIELPNTLTSIGVGAFSGCKGLTSIEIPNSVKTIGASAFGVNAQLETVILDIDTPEQYTEVWLGDAKPNIRVNPDIFDRIYTSDYQYASLCYPNDFVMHNLRYKSTLGENHYELTIDAVEDNADYIKFMPVIYDSLQVLSYNPEISLAGNSQLKSVFFDAPLAEIPAGFCANASSLSNVILHDAVKSIGNAAFEGASVSYIQSLATLPPVIEGDIFGTTMPEGKILATVPAESLPAYMEDENWSKFFMMRADSDSNNIGWDYELTDNGVGVVLTGLEAGKMTDEVLRIPARIKDSSFEVDVLAVRFESLPEKYKSIVIEESDKPLSIDCALGALVGETCTHLTVGRNIVGREDLNTVFGGSEITSVLFDGKASKVEDALFKDNTKLESVEFRDNVSTIGGYAFAGATSLPSVEIGNGITSIGNNAFEGATSLISLVIGNGVTTIGNHAFKGATALKTIDFGENTASIGDYAFADATSLPSVVIGNGVTSIGNHAFGGATSLTSVEIGNGVTTIGDYAFEGATNLKTVSFGENLVSIGDYAFANLTKLYSRQTLDLSATKLQRIGSKAFRRNRMFNIKFPETLRVVADSAFSDCTGIKELVFADSISSIGEDAFVNCTGIASLTMKDYVDRVAPRAFFNNTNLSSIVTEKGIGTICGSAFEQCNKLESVDIKADVVEARAFADCKVLKNFSVSGKDRIEADALAECPELLTLHFDIAEVNKVSPASTLLETVEFGDNVTTIKESAFNGFPIKNLKFGTGLITIGDYAFANNKCDSIIFPTVAEANPQISINSYAFYQSENLRKVDLGNLVQYVGYNAFGASSFDCLDLGSSVEVIDNHAIFLSYKGENLKIPGSLKKIGFINGYEGYWIDYDKIKNIDIEYSDNPIEVSQPIKCDTLIIDRSIGDYPIYGSIETKAGTRLNTPLMNYALRYTPYIGNMVVGKGVKILSGSFSCGSIQFDEGIEELRSDITIDSLSDQTLLTLPGSLIKLNAGGINGETISQLIIRDGDGKIEAYDTSKADFSALSNVKEVYLGKEIEGMRFYNHANIETVMVGDSVKAIGTELFRDCKALTNVIMNDNVTEVRAGAFSGCTGLKVLSMSETLATIGENAYEGCTGFERIVARGLTPASGVAGFSAEVEANVPLYVPEEAIDDYYDSDLFWQFNIIEPDTENVADNIVIEDNNVDEGFNSGNPGHSFSFWDLIRWIIKGITGHNAPARVKAMAAAADVDSPESYGLYFFTPDPDKVSVDQEGTVTILKEEPAEVWVYALDGSDKKAVLEVNNAKELLGDLNSDRLVDTRDLNVLIEHVRNPENAPVKIKIADMNGDGVINSIDINILIKNVLNQN